MVSRRFGLQGAASLPYKGNARNLSSGPVSLQLASTVAGSPAAAQRNGPPSQPTAAQARKVALRGILELALAPRRHLVLADVTKASFAGTRRATMT
jgi:hypothetical protein